MKNNRKQNTHKMQKKTAKAKAKTFLMHLFCFWFACVCCCLHISLCMFLHLFSGQLNACVCVVVHSNDSLGDLFLRFLCIFCSIGFAFVCLVHAFFVSSELTLVYTIILLLGTSFGNRSNIRR